MRRAGIVVTAVLVGSVVAHAAVEVEPASVVLGSEQVVRVRVTDGAVVTSSLGEVRGGVLELGERRAPGFAIVAQDVGGERSAAVVELVGSGALPTETSPGAQVTVEIDGRSFGPVTADADGKAAVPVEVPPRARSAKVIALDTRGLSTTREIALPQAPWPRGLVVAPATLRAGDDGVVTVFALAEDGGWREAAAAPPVLELHGALVAAGPARALGAGRWDFPVRGVVAAEVAVDARVDDLPAASARITVTPKPREVEPPPPPIVPHAPWTASLRAGASTSFGDLTSMSIGAELGWPLRAGQPTLLLVGSVLGARGTTEAGDLSQLSLGLGACVRFSLAPAWFLDAQIGAGWTLASANLEMSTETDGAPVTWAGLALARQLGGGSAALVDFRWSDVRLAGALRTDPNALGFGASLGYRVDF